MPKKQSGNPQSLERRTRISAERNLESWPIFQPAESRGAPQLKRIERSIPVDNGDRIEAVLEVSYDPRLGPLTTEDQMVFYALLKIWWESDRPDVLRLSLRQLAKTLNWSWGKKERQHLVRSLQRLADTPMTWHNAYRDSRTNRFLRMLKSYRFLADFQFLEAGKGNKVTSQTIEVRFHEITLANLRNFHTKPVLFDTVIGFRSGIALLLYRHVDLILADKPRYARRTQELFNDLCLAGQEYRYKSARKRTLERAFKELRGAPLSHGGYLDLALEPTKDGLDYNLVCTKVKRTPLALAPAPAPRAALAPPRAEPSAPRGARGKAEQVLRHFYSVFHGHEAKTFVAKERKQAEELVAELGLDRARYLVDYAKQHTGRNFRPQFFGYILPFADRARAEYDRRAGGDQIPLDFTAVCRFCGGESHLWVRDREGKATTIGCPHDEAKLEAWLERHGLELVPPRGAPGE